MFKMIKIICGNIKKDTLNNIIMIIFIFFSIFLMNISLSRFIHQEYINNLVQDCGLYDNYMYFSPPIKKAYRQENNDMKHAAAEYARNQLYELKAENKIDSYFTVANFGGAIMGDDNDRTNYYFYPPELAIDLHFPVSKGKWFSDYTFENGLTPVVIGSELAGRFKIGGKYTFRCIDGECIVIGVLKRNTMILRAGSGGSGMDLDGTFALGNNAIIACEEYKDKMFNTGTIIIKSSVDNQQEIFDRIGDISYMFTFKELAERAYEANRYNTEMQTIVFVLMIVVCVAGVSSGNLLATISCKKKFAVYFMCGMDWKTSVWITLTESIIKLVIPATVGYAMFYKWCSDRSFFTLRISETNIVITVFFLFGIFLLTSLMPLLDISRTSPVKIISEI